MNIVFKLILEALNKAQKDEVDTWDRGDYSFSDHAFDNNPNKMTTTFSLTLDNKPSFSEHEEKVKQHINDNGGHVIDYHNNVALNKSGQTTKVSKLIKDKDLLDQYSADPSRTYSNKIKSKDGYYVKISRHPHDVAAMSTGQNWTSCMTMGNCGETGGYSSHLQDDIEHGTHVAYLYHNSNPDTPLARIALKPHEEHIYGDNNNKVLVPEDKMYGNIDRGVAHKFKKGVEDWADEHFGDTYENRYYKRKNPALYDDDNSGEDFDETKKENDREYYHDIAQGKQNPPNSDYIHDIINYAHDNYDSDVIESMIKNKSHILKPEHLNAMADILGRSVIGTDIVNHLLVHRPHLMTKEMKYKFYELPHVNKGNLNDNHPVIDYINKLSAEELYDYTENNDNLKPDHIHAIINKINKKDDIYNSLTAEELADRRDLSKSHIEHLSQFPNQIFTNDIKNRAKNGYYYGHNNYVKGGASKDLFESRFIEFLNKKIIQ